MSESNLENKMKDLKIGQKNDINILLLGETGMGKSTLINAFANYLTYSDFKRAKKEHLLVLIPTQFRVEDKNKQDRTINTGEGDKNEYLETGESATQDVKTYVFPIWNGQTKVRLIDTPGMGDTRGVAQDDINSENILSYIGNLHELHAICFLLKPSESRCTVSFKYCIHQIFSRLDKSACDNIIFCFTNTRGTDYGPGETMSILKKTVEEVGNKKPFAKIPLNRNIFCFDNEPFKYLAAVKEGVEFDSVIKERNKESWDQSAKECWKLINYIVGDKENKPLKPHFVKSTSAINEARRMITHLAQPLAEISQLIHHNMYVLERHRENLAHDSGALEEMKKKLYMPVISLETTNLTQPVTVCAARKCADVYKVAGKNVWHYKQRCHDPCYLVGVEKEMIGAPGLINCAAMAGTKTCTQCFCDFSVHMHVYYMTKTKEGKEKDENMEKNITTREQLLKSKEKVIRDIERRKKELNEEHNEIVRICAIFAHFLQSNAITAFNDAYKDYIEYLIDREKSLGNLCDKDSIDHLNNLLLRYVEIKKQFDDALDTSRNIGRDNIISPKDIKENIEKLYKLKHNGKKIKELYECQKKSRSKEFQNTEYVHKITFKKEEKKVKSEKKDKEKDSKESDNKTKKSGESKESDNKTKKSRENKNKEKSTKNETQRTRAPSPPPSYQEAHNQRSQHPNRGRSQQYGNPRGEPYPPGPHPQYPQYPPPGPASYPQVPHPPPNYVPSSGPYRYGHDYSVPEVPDTKINISFSKNEPGAHQQQYDPRPPNPNYPNYPHYPPYPDPRYPDPRYPHPPAPHYNDPHYSQRPPYGSPSYPPSQDPAYPPHSSGPYDPSYKHHHGVNRQHSGEAYVGNSSGRGRGSNYRGGRGRGGVLKNRPKKNKDEKNEKEKKKPKKGKKSSDDSDSSSSSDS